MTDKSQALNKIIKYWIYSAQKTLLTWFAFWIVYMLFFAMMQGGIYGILEALGNYAYMFLLFVFVSELTIAMSSITYQIPVVISFGSTRKEAYLGQQIAMFFVGVECAVFTSLCFFAMDKAGIMQTESKMYLFIVIIMLLGNAAGQLMAVMMNRFGAKGIAMAIFSILVFVIVTVAGIMVAVGANMSWLFEMEYGFVIFGIIVCAVICVVMSLVVRKRVMKLEVKF